MNLHRVFVTKGVLGTGAAANTIVSPHVHSISPHGHVQRDMSARYGRIWDNHPYVMLKHAKTGRSEFYSVSYPCLSALVSIQEIEIKIQAMLKQRAAL